MIKKLLRGKIKSVIRSLSIELIILGIAISLVALILFFWAR